jgi:hypothetical protein
VDHRYLLSTKPRPDEMVVTPAGPAAATGRVRARRLAGTLAFDRLREVGGHRPIHGLRHLSNALRLAPSYTLQSLARKLIPRSDADLIGARSREHPCRRVPYAA